MTHHFLKLFWETLFGCALVGLLVLLAFHEHVSRYKDELKRLETEKQVLFSLLLFFLQHKAPVLPPKENE